MLQIAPNPDAAYEICTIFALDCKSQSRTENRYNFTSSSKESYEGITEEDSNENHKENLHVSPNDPINITFILRPTLEIPYNNQTVVHPN
jgi:hypothetical protein